MESLKIHLSRQDKRMCSPASLQMILKYYNKSYTKDELKEKRKTTYFFGTSPKEIVKAAKTFGLKAKYSKNNTIQDLKNNIKKRIPPIIGWFSPDSGSHFSVVIGFKKNKIIIADPDMEQIRKMNIKEFSNRWLDVNWSKFSIIKRLYLFSIMNIHNKFSNKNYKTPIKKSNLSSQEMILIKP